MFIQCFVNPISFGWYVHWVLVGMFSEFCFTRRGQKWSRNISFASGAQPWHCWLWSRFLRSCSFQSVFRKWLVFEEVCVSDVSTFELGHRRYTESLTFWCLVQEQRWIWALVFYVCILFSHLIWRRFCLNCHWQHCWHTLYRLGVTHSSDAICSWHPLV